MNFLTVNDTYPGLLFRSCRRYNREECESMKGKEKDRPTKGREVNKKMFSEAAERYHVLSRVDPI